MNDFATELAHDGAVDDGRIGEARRSVAEYFEGLRCASAWIAKHDEALVASIGLCDYAADDWAGFGSVDNHALTIYVYGERQRERVAELVAQIGGKWDKNESGTQFELSHKITPLFRVRFWVDREQVCVKKVVGTEEVEVTDMEAVKELPKKTITRDVIEWECAPLLSGAKTEREGEVNGN